MGAPVGNVSAVSHGATSERKIRPLARNHRRRVLRQIGLRSSDLDAVGRGYLDLYVRLVAKLDLLDEHLDSVGLLKANGEPQGATKFYISLANSARLSLARLEEHVRARQNDPVIDLNRYLEAKRDAPRAS
ncbi:MAG: hypothetical protein H0X39_03870 [Actinobacteria bacterium]|nr:hypothetical protein [Actinomycetota bacterium]